MCNRDAPVIPVLRSCYLPTDPIPFQALRQEQLSLQEYSHMSIQI